MCISHSQKEGIDLDELELELIDYGVDEVNGQLVKMVTEIVLYGEFTSYAAIQTYLRKRHEIFGNLTEYLIVLQN